MAGRAMQEVLSSAGHTAEFMDVMMLSGKKTSRAVGGAYIGLSRHFPNIFGGLYKAGKLVTSKNRKSPVYYANCLLVNRLYDYIFRNRYDAIVMPHLFPAEMITGIYKRMPNVKMPLTVAIATDYTCIPFWEETACDYYVIPHEELTEEFVNAGIRRDKIRTYGIPVSQEYSKNFDKKSLRIKAGIPQDAIVYMIAGGSMGYDKMNRFSIEFAERISSNEYCIITCGSNKEMYSYLKRRLCRYKNVKILGYTTHMPEYLALSDVYYTKPGGLSSTEAAVRNIPTVFLSAIPGCEIKNKEFFISHGMASGAEGVTESLNEGRRLYAMKHESDNMKFNQRKYLNPKAAEDIMHFMEGAVHEN